MSRPKSNDKGIRLSIYLKESQLKMLDERCAKAGMTRSKFIEFSCGLGNLIENKQGDYGKGKSKK